MRNALTSNELNRYDRQIMIFNKKGQLKLKRTRILIAGVGGLGSASALYSAAVGFGKIFLVDHEVVELSNLNRQILYWAEDIGKKKVRVAAEKLRKLNPEITVEYVEETITEENVSDLVSGVDIVLDGMDNWRARFLLNEACVKRKIPFIHGAVEGLVGQMLTIIPYRGPCLQCIFSKAPPPKPVFPILGTTPGVIALLQVTEAVKIITGYGEPAIGKMIVYDGYDMSFREVKVLRRIECPVCGGSS